LDDILGPVRQLLLVMTSLIVFVSGIGIFVSIYNSMSARRREIAIMRALGAQRVRVTTDLHPVLFANAGPGSGVLVVAGTGSAVIAKNRDAWIKAWTTAVLQ